MARRGITLVEILVAVFVMAAVLLPVLTIFMGLGRKDEYLHLRDTSINLAQSMMNDLLSEKVPFDAIVPNARDDLPAAANGLKQAALGGYEFLISDEPDEGRFVVRDGARFDVYLFAGIYPDEEDTRRDPAHPSDPSRTIPDPCRELTFTFYPNPYMALEEQDEDAKKRLLFDAPGTEDLPYWRTPTMDDPSHPDFRPGWPNPSDGDPLHGDYTASNLPVYSDQSYHGESSGVLMKLVLGVAMKPPARISTGGGPRKPYEFWLVSMKARLVERSAP